jgi:hypothetical protein
MIKIDTNCIHCKNKLHPTETMIEYRQVWRCRGCQSRYTPLLKLEDEKLILDRLIEIESHSKYWDKDGRKHETDTDTQP